MTETFYQDPVVAEVHVAEVHVIRAQMLAECGGDHHKLMELVRQRQQASGRRVRKAPPEVSQITKRCTGPGTAGLPMETELPGR